jgi:hypothetical protein
MEIIVDYDLGSTAEPTLEADGCQVHEMIYVHLTGHVIASKDNDFQRKAVGFCNTFDNIFLSLQPFSFSNM